MEAEQARDGLVAAEAGKQQLMRQRRGQRDETTFLVYGMRLSLLRIVTGLRIDLQFTQGIWFSGVLPATAECWLLPRIGLRYTVVPSTIIFPVYFDWRAPPRLRVAGLRIPALWGGILTGLLRQSGASLTAFRYLLVTCTGVFSGVNGFGSFAKQIPIPMPDDLAGQLRRHSVRCRRASDYCACIVLLASSQP